MSFLIECVDAEQADQINNFVAFAYEKLGIMDPPIVSFEPHLGTTSFGLYSPEDDVVTVAVEGRHTSDILRTTAHELVHHVQMTLGDIETKPIEELEYQANAVAGMLMRDYNKLHPEMFGLASSEPSPPGTIGDSQGATAADTTRPSQPTEMAEAKIKETDSDALKLLKLGNMALRAFPSSPRQQELQKQIDDLRKNMKRKGTPEYHSTLKEDAVVNAAGAGNVAGIGIGPDGEPGFKKSKILKRKTLKQLKESWGK